MHELGIVFHIIKEVKKSIEGRDDIKNIQSVTLEIGEVSNVIPYYLIDCWKWAVSKEDKMQNCKLKYDLIKAKSFCSTCKSEFETIKNGKICPFCKSDDTFLLQGNEVTIKEIEVI